MSKMYAVMKDGKVTFGPVPESEYAKVVSHLNTFPPEERKKYKVIFTNAQPAATQEAPKVATPSPVAQTKPAPKPASKPQAQPIVEKQTVGVAQGEGGDDFTFDNSASTFGSYLEGGGSSDYWKPKEGRNIIRILPIGGVNPNDWQTPYPMLLSGVHPNVGLSMQETVYCPRLTHNKACPICAFVWKLYNTKNPEDIELAKKIKAYKRILANIIDLADIDAGVQKFAFGKKLAAKIVSYLQDPDTRYVLHPDKGNNFILIKKVVEGFPNYDESRFEMKSTPLSGIYENWRSEIHDLRLDIKEKSYDELVLVLKDTKKALLTATTDEVDPTTHAVEPLPAADEQPSALTPETTEVTEVSLDELDQKLNNF